jgi:hypothetical protein
VLVPAALAGLAAGGRGRAELEIGSHMMVATGPDERAVARAAANVRRTISFYGSTRTYRAVFAHHGWGDVTDRLHGMSLAGAWARMPDLISDGMVDAFAVVAPYDRLAGEIRRRYEGVCDRVSIGLPATAEGLEAAGLLLRDLRSDATAATPAGGHPPALRIERRERQECEP